MLRLTLLTFPSNLHCKSFSWEFERPGKEKEARRKYDNFVDFGFRYSSITGRLHTWKILSARSLMAGLSRNAAILRRFWAATELLAGSAPSWSSLSLSTMVSSPPAEVK